MKNSKIVLAVFFLIWYSIIFGFVVPTTISADNDVLPLFGAGLAVIHVIGPILWFNREKKQEIV